MVSQPAAATSYTREETLDVLYDISQLLQTGLDRESLAVLVGLTETGVNPEALAAVVKELRRESVALQAAEANAEGGTLVPGASALSGQSVRRG
mmetsp:Transcript_71907/g.159958  ORF Transcript_71907/g.159958 Transcript_71907/m.159958 type:complete len:94 (-) Transcript_71907:527-808(-)